MKRVQQMTGTDEIDVAGIEQLWLKGIAEEIVPECLPAEITAERVKDTNITTVWSQGRPIAIAIRQRDIANRTVLTLVVVDKVLNPERAARAPAPACR